MRRAPLVVLFLVLALPFALVGAVFLALEDQPLVSRTADSAATQLERAKRVLEQNDPRRMRPGERRTVSLSQQDLESLADYFFARYGRGGARIALERGVASVAASAALPANPVGRYLNVSASLREADGALAVDGVRIGRLPIPDWLAGVLVEQALAKLRENEDFRVASAALRTVAIGPGRLDATLEWRPDLPARLARALVPREEQERLRPYQERLARITAGADAKAELPFPDLLNSLLDLAGERSAGGDPVAENRAALLVLGAYLGGRGLGPLAPAGNDWPRAAARPVTLGGRRDFAQHFAISAALAAGAGGAFADAIGTQKEIDDLRGGSGFSFGDIAADRAGARLGEAATADAASARKLQARARTGVRDADIMVAASDLPDFMPEAEFKRRFGGVDAPAYKRMMAEIDRRVGALPAYR